LWIWISRVRIPSPTLDVKSTESPTSGLPVGPRRSGNGNLQTGTYRFADTRPCQNFVAPSHLILSTSIPAKQSPGSRARISTLARSTHPNLGNDTIGSWPNGWRTADSRRAQGRGPDRRRLDDRQTHRSVFGVRPNPLPKRMTLRRKSWVYSSRLRVEDCLGVTQVVSSLPGSALHDVQPGPRRCSPSTSHPSRATPCPPNVSLTPSPGATAERGGLPQEPAPAPPGHLPPGPQLRESPPERPAAGSRGRH
jgi:hypothetical protein